jgi:hypothetical protein
MKERLSFEAAATDAGLMSSWKALAFRRRAMSVTGMNYPQPVVDDIG